MLTSDLVSRISGWSVACCVSQCRCLVSCSTVMISFVRVIETELCVRRGLHQSEPVVLLISLFWLLKRMLTACWLLSKGESGLGKSTLINSLFLTDLYPERVIPGAAGKKAGFFRALSILKANNHLINSVGLLNENLKLTVSYVVSFSSNRKDWKNSSDRGVHSRNWGARGEAPSHRGRHTRIRRRHQQPRLVWYLFLGHMLMRNF